MTTFLSSKLDNIQLSFSSLVATRIGVENFLVFHFVGTIPTP